MEKVVLKGFVIVPDDDLDVVLSELPSHIENTISENGCLIFEVNQDIINPNKLNVYEEFVNKSAFQRHQQRVANSKWGLVAKNCERHYEVGDI
jgi:autoinducer 2-degrading protein